jgi:hypothetical protein
VPIYELTCEDGHRSETPQASTAPLPACPARGGATRKLPSGFGVPGADARRDLEARNPELAGDPPPEGSGREGS